MKASSKLFALTLAALALLPALQSQPIVVDGMALADVLVLPPGVPNSFKNWYKLAHVSVAQGDEEAAAGDFLLAEAMYRTAQRSLDNAEKYASQAERRQHHDEIQTFRVVWGDKIEKMMQRQNRGHQTDRAKAQAAAVAQSPQERAESDRRIAAMHDVTSATKDHWAKGLEMEKANDSYTALMEFRAALKERPGDAEIKAHVALNWQRWTLRNMRRADNAKFLAELEEINDLIDEIKVELPKQPSLAQPLAQVLHEQARNMKYLKPLDRGIAIWPGAPLLLLRAKLRIDGRVELAEAAADLDLIPKAPMPAGADLRERISLAIEAMALRARLKELQAGTAEPIPADAPEWSHADPRTKPSLDLVRAEAYRLYALSIMGPRYYREAYENFREMHFLKPGDPEAMTYMAYNLAELAKMVEGLAEYAQKRAEQLKEYGELKQKAYANMAYNRAAARVFSEMLYRYEMDSLEAMDMAVKTWPSSSVLVKRAELRLKAKVDLEGALEDLDQAPQYSFPEYLNYKGDSEPTFRKYQANEIEKLRKAILEILGPRAPAPIPAPAPKPAAPAPTPVATITPKATAPVKPAKPAKAVPVTVDGKPDYLKIAQDAENDGTPEDVIKACDAGLAGYSKSQLSQVAPRMALLAIKLHAMLYRAMSAEVLQLVVEEWRQNPTEQGGRSLPNTHLAKVTALLDDVPAHDELRASPAMQEVLRKAHAALPNDENLRASLAYSLAFDAWIGFRDGLRDAEASLALSRQALEVRATGQAKLKHARILLYCGKTREAVELAKECSGPAGPDGEAAFICSDAFRIEGKLDEALEAYEDYEEESYHRLVLNFSNPEKTGELISAARKLVEESSRFQVPAALLAYLRAKHAASTPDMKFLAKTFEELPAGFEQTVWKGLSAANIDPLRMIADGKAGPASAYTRAKARLWLGLLLAEQGQKDASKALLKQAKSELPRWRIEWDLADRELARL